MNESGGKCTHAQHEMSVNKFGDSLNRASGDDRRAIESLRGYVRNSALCLDPDHYDAKKRRIVRVARPSLENDVTNKAYVDDAFVERDRSLTQTQNDVEKVRESVSDLSRSMNSIVENRVEILSRKVNELQTLQRENQRASARLKQEGENLSKNINELSSSLEELKRKIRDTTVKKKTLEKTIKDLESRLRSTLRNENGK